MPDSIPGQMALALPEPAAVEVAQASVLADRAIEWATSCDDLPSLEDTRAKLAAIEAYLRGQNEAASAEIGRADRVIEIRIGELLGPPEHGGDRGKSPASDLPLSKNQRSQFRKMAANKTEPAVAAAVERGASRAQVLAAVPADPRRPMNSDEKAARVRAAQRQLRNWIKEAERIADLIAAAHLKAWKTPFDEWAAEAGAKIVEASHRKGQQR